jgi:hypothetical protein
LAREVYIRVAVIVIDTSVGIRNIYIGGEGVYVRSRSLQLVGKDVRY